MAYDNSPMGEGEHRLDHRHADGPVVGLTGARFGGAAGRRRRLTGREEQGRDQQGRTAQPISAAAAPRFDSVPVVEPPPEFESGDSSDGDSSDEVEWDLPDEVYDLVRPYSWTGGRTAPSHDLAIEALISATGQAPDPAAGPEHHAIHGLCGSPRSVAELAALLSVPLGVVRVVLGDMAAAGSVMVHDTAGSADGAPDLALMRRVLSCLQRL